MRLIDDHKEYINKLVENNEIREAFLKYSETSILIKLKEKNESDIKIGASKFGGSPHLPKDFTWLKRENKHDNIVSIDSTNEQFKNLNEYRYNSPWFEFVCQINFNDLKDFDYQNLLPKTGILYLFVNNDDYIDTDDFSSENIKLIYQNNLEEDLIRFNPPKESLFELVSDNSQFRKNKSYEIEFEYFLNPMNNWDHEFKYNFSSESLEEEYNEYRQQIIKNYSQENSYYYDKRIILLGLESYTHVRYGINYKEEEELVDYIPLLRIPEGIKITNTDERIVYQWDNGSAIVFWIKEEDLLNGNFENFKVNIYEDD